MITVVEISECFPNKNKPVTGEFILQHVRALAEHCRVIMIVPLRLIPSRELLSINPFKLFVNLKNWLTDIKNTENFKEGNLSVIYLPYISLPRPYFEISDVELLNKFYFGKLKEILKDLSPDVLCCNWLRPWAKVSGRLAKHINIPFIIDHHEDLPTLKELFPDNFRELTKYFEAADKIIVHSSVNKTDLENEDLKLNEIKVVYLGQNFSVSQNLKKFNFSELRLVCVSHLNEKRKNIDLLLNAVSLIKEELNFRLTIAGDGVYKQNYIELSKSLKLSDRVNFKGSMSRKEVENILEDSDIFILPSFPEAFGVVYIEALAKGLPVITCKGNGGGEELLKLGYPVILTNPDSSQELAESILELSENKKKMEMMSESGKEILQKNFSWEKNADATYEFITKTISEYKLRNNVRN